MNQININLDQAWSDQSLLDFYEKNRNSYENLYESEKIFVDRILKEETSYLDLGCALGGFASVLKEKLHKYNYVGVDASKTMINQALLLHDRSHDFFHCPDGVASCGLEILSDYVICLGFLHLHKEWRDTLLWALNHSKKGLLFDLRETPFDTIEDISECNFNTNFNDLSKEKCLLPYNVINCEESTKLVEDLFSSWGNIYQYGYLQEGNNNNSSKVWMKTYFIEKF